MPQPKTSPSPAAHRQPPQPGRSRAARLAYERLILNAYAEEVERHDGRYDLREVIPEAWDTLEQDLDLPERKIRVTIRLDESVVKYFRALGPGYSRAMNRVLATYAQMKIAEVRLGDRRLEAFRRGQEEDG